MSEHDEIPKWRMYERFVASLYSSAASDTVTVIPNAELLGAISGVPRQIDLLIDTRLEDDVSRRVIVDAKCWKRKVDVTDVEVFEAMMRDCRAHRGIIVCASGFTEGAKRRAQTHIGLGLVPLEDLEKLDLTAWENCRGVCSRAESRRARKGWILYDQPFGLAIGDSPLTVLVVGKCDECRNFHIWCWTCGSKFALGDEAEYHCGCDWFWLTAVQEEGRDETGNHLEAVLLLLVTLNPIAGVILVDCRPLA
ncbi:MAG TPA: restriction endonuclease [Candidatus Angelobacter sp.]|nr:restriction endonuclease [Candidatus Angelobacter sp.]